jgi:hypothetical protein
MADIAGGLVAAGLVDRWRDMALELWLAAGGIALAWALLLGLCMAWTDPRKVDPGPATLDLGGPEPPAIVNLLANDWRLEDESMPATLLDLAARKHVAIEQVGDRTFVRVPSTPPAAGTRTDTLTPYEDMVLDHVRGLAGQGGDGMVPAEALTTGPDAQAKGWWKTYRTAVERDARDRGLARKRWSPAVHTLLVATALVVAGALGLAVSALPEDDDDDSNPVGAALGLAVVSWGGLVGAVEGAGRRQRDTPAGREVAARWLGLREMLAQNPLFAEQPPAGVAIWDRHIAHGAALGVAHGAVAALPLGAESDTTAWSAVGGRWRVVHIRYPSLVPPGYGRHPLRAAAVGLFQLAIAGTVLSKLLPALLAAPGDLEAEGVEVAGEEAFLLGVQVLVTGIGAIAVLATARAAWMSGAGVLDLVGGRRTVQGRVLRFRTKGSDDRTRSYMAVDDGTAHRVRAWCFHRGRGGNQGSWVRAEVTRHLQHVKDLTTVEAPEGPGGTSGPGDTTGRDTGQGTPSPVGTAENPPARTNAHEMTASGE